MKKKIPKLIRIYDWSVCAGTGPYTAPELQYLKLLGKVKGHPEFKTGATIKTSAIIKTDGRKVYTKSGSVYFLGRINSDYRQYLRRIEHNYDIKNPIKVAE